METSRKACRLCLVETDFNISVFSNYCRKINMIDKILVCLHLVIEETDVFNTICYKCANNVEKYYEFITSVKKSQARVGNAFSKPHQTSVSFNIEEPGSVKRHVTSYVREQVFDADYTFSFLEIPKEEKKEPTSSPFFSYFSAGKNEPVWKTPRISTPPETRRESKQDKYRRPLKTVAKAKHLSGDLFEYQSQDEENSSEKDWSEWKFTPDSNIIKKVREKCFGRVDF